MTDERFKNCQKQHTPAPRREGEPRRWVAGHTDQHVVHPDPWKPGMNFVVQSREAAEDLARILNAQPPSADLVAAAREVSSLEGRSIAQITGWLAKPRDTRRYIKVGCDPLLRLAAALQNTPQPDESEAVKLLRELVKAIDTYGEQRIQYWPETVAAVRFLSNTPEVDNAE